MRTRFLGRAAAAAALLGTWGCASSVEAPATSPRTLVASRVVGDALPATHYCTPASPNTEQWVALSGMELTIEPRGAFSLTATDGQGNAQFTLSDAGTKTYVAQMAVGGARSVAGTLVPAQDGVREARVDRATSIYGNPADFTARVAGDSAIVTDQVHCLTTVGADSVHVFTVILR